MKMRHPKSKQIVDVREDYVEMYRSQGWEPAKEKSTPKGDEKGK